MPDKGAVTEGEVFELAWKYFQQHASQRISFFNFFVVLASSMVALLVAALFQLKAYPIGAAVGLMLAFISFIFWKVDERNKHLTKTGEHALKELESRYGFLPKFDDATADKGPAVLRIFTREEWATKKLREAQRGRPIWRRQLSLSRCLDLLFIVYGIAGCIGAALAIIFILSG